MEKEYIIQAKYLDGNWYLYTLAGYSLKHAETVLNKVLTNPSRYNPKHGSYSDFRILELESKDCWWNKGTLD